MTKSREALREEAVDIFLRLDSDPEDASAQSMRDAFIARGPDERRAYESVAESWSVSRPDKVRRGPTGRAILAIAAVVGVGWFVGPELLIRLEADHVAGKTPRTITLASGDLVYLDAGSAISESIDDVGRKIDLLRGAAFFEVTPDTRPFIVTASGVEARATGTGYQVEMTRNEVLVGINEGSVEVRFGKLPVMLEAGEVARVSQSQLIDLGIVDPATIGRWRTGEIVLQDAPLSTLVEVLNRRIAGGIIILDESLSDAKVTGVFSLEDPLATLQLAASLHGASVIAAPPLLTILTR
ncbi:MAG: FecR domain-containing protein [Pseudomonadota bacterium]